MPAAVRTSSFGGSTVRIDEPCGATAAPPLGAAETEVLREAIRSHRLISVSYNRGRSMLAPYVTFTRRGETYLRAVTVARDGAEPSRLKLGTFKLSGLGDVQATPLTFSPSELYRRVEAAEGARRNSRTR